MIWFCIVSCTVKGFQVFQSLLTKSVSFLCSLLCQSGKGEDNELSAMTKVKKVLSDETSFPFSISLNVTLPMLIGCQSFIKSWKIWHVFPSDLSGLFIHLMQAHMRQLIYRAWGFCALDIYILKIKAAWNCTAHCKQEEYPCRLQLLSIGSLVRSIASSCEAA